MILRYKPKNEINSILIQDTGYIANSDYLLKCEKNNIYCTEINIIEKIKENYDWIFDFSKSMIDIGSCIGLYSFMLDYNYTYMFEPNKEFCIISEMNMLIHNKQYNYELYNTLLSDCEEIIKYDGFETNLSYATNADIHGFDINSCVDVYSTVMDNYNLNNIDFIKIDVEGMEEKVLRGAQKTILNNNYPKILFELWPVNWNGMTQEKHDSLQNFLESLGYQIFWEWGQFDTHLAIHKSQINLNII